MCGKVVSIADFIRSRPFGINTKGNRAGHATSWRCRPNAFNRYTRNQTTQFGALMGRQMIIPPNWHLIAAIDLLTITRCHGPQRWSFRRWHASVHRPLSRVLLVFCVCVLWRHNFNNSCNKAICGCVSVGEWNGSLWFSDSVVYLRDWHRDRDWQLATKGNGVWKHISTLW